MQHDIVLKKLNFDLLSLRVSGGGGSAGKIFVTIALFCDFNKVDMQHAQVLKRLTLTHLQGVSVGKIFATMLLHS